MQQTEPSVNSALQHYQSTGTRFDFFSPIVLLSLFFFGWSGWYMHTHNPLPVSIPDQLSKMQQTRFILDEPKPAPKIEKPRPVEKKVEQPLPQEPIDLTKNPILNQPKDDIVDNPAPQPQTQKPARRVYGLKKVYSTGIGASGNASDAVIGKLGNTLDTDIDTITATESDLKSAPVSITTLTVAPRPKTVVKPEYSKEMLDNKIEGVVRVKVLIDIDGRVKQAIVLDDLGFGTKQAVADACFKSLFEPGLVGDRPASVWIQLKFRFEMLNG